MKLLFRSAEALIILIGLSAAALAARMPAPAGAIEPAGEEIVVETGWKSNGRDVRAGTEGFTRFPVNSRRMQSGAVNLVERNAYLVKIPVRSEPGSEITAGVIFGESEQVFWPRWHRAGHVQPEGGISGIVIVPPGSGKNAEIFVSGNGAASSLSVGNVRLQPLGIPGGEKEGILFTCGFEHWDSTDRPSCLASVSFARPGQLIRSRVSRLPGGFSAHNREGRAMLFGQNIRCAFGSVLRISARIKGEGSLMMRMVPYLDISGRGEPPSEKRTDVRGDWREIELIVPQNNPAADRIVLHLDIRGEIYLDEVKIEVL